MAEYSNGTGKCPTGAVNSQAIGELRRRIDVVETKTERIEERTEQHFAAVIGKLDAVLTDRETQRAKLGISGTIAVAVVAALATILAQLLPQLVK
jgi:hypothetical protein